VPSTKSQIGSMIGETRLYKYMDVLCLYLKNLDMILGILFDFIATIRLQLTLHIIQSSEIKLNTLKLIEIQSRKNCVQE
jgi:hypothetical protein